MFSVNLHFKSYTFNSQWYPVFFFAYFYPKTWWTIQKSHFFKSSDLSLGVKSFFCSFWLIFYPLDSDPDPGSQNLADPVKPKFIFNFQNRNDTVCSNSIRRLPLHVRVTENCVAIRSLLNLPYVFSVRKWERRGGRGYTRI